MAPFYRGYDPFFKMHSDDISGIQGLYGVKSDDEDDGDQEFGGGGGSGGSGTNFPEDEDEEADIRDLCDDGGRFDAIMGTADDEYFVFKGSKYYKLTDDSVAAGYPKSILDGWPGLPSNIDAAVTWPGNSKTYFFKGAVLICPKISEQGSPLVKQVGFVRVSTKSKSTMLMVVFIMRHVIS